MTEDERLLKALRAALDRVKDERQCNALGAAGMIHQVGLRYLYDDPRFAPINEYLTNAGEMAFVYDAEVKRAAIRATIALIEPAPAPPPLTILGVL